MGAVGDLWCLEEDGADIWSLEEDGADIWRLLRRRGHIWRPLRRRGYIWRPVWRPAGEVSDVMRLRGLTGRPGGVVTIGNLVEAGPDVRRSGLEVSIAEWRCSVLRRSEAEAVTARMEGGEVMVVGR